MIEYAAISRNGQILTGKRHAPLIFHAIFKLGWKEPIRQDEQGFVDSEGKFHNRQESLEIAIKSGQIRPDFNNVLLSEYLWPNIEE